MRSFARRQAQPSSLTTSSAVSTSAIRIRALTSMRNTTRFAEGRSRDIVCLGRFGVDFYAQQIGARLEDVTSFAKYLGGSSANTAFGCARLGLRAGLISRVGDDAMG